MPLLSLADFELDALATLVDASRPSRLSRPTSTPSGPRTATSSAAELLADWARRAPSRQRRRRDPPPRRSHADARRHCRLDRRATTGTVMLYGHLDKQPPLGQLVRGARPVPTRSPGRSPLRARRRRRRLRLFAALSALEAMEVNGIPHGRCVVLIEASEESGSVDLEAYLDDLARPPRRRSNYSSASTPAPSPTTDCGSRPRCAAWSTSSSRSACSKQGRTAARRVASCPRRFASCANCSIGSKTPRPARSWFPNCTRRIPGRARRARPTHR